MTNRTKKEKNDNPKTKTDMLYEQLEMLPLSCQSFIYETGTNLAVSTRLAYARELNEFYDFLVSDKYIAQHNFAEDIDSFVEKNKKDLTLNDIKQITPSAISQYLTYRKTANDSERTLARKRAALSSFFNYMVTNRKVDYNPVLASAKVKIHQSDTVTYITLKDQNRLLDDIISGDKLCDKQKLYHEKYQLRDLAIVTLLLDTGMRISELHGINVQDIDFEDSWIVVTRKGGNIQKIYFSDSTNDILSEYIHERELRGEEVKDTSPLFVTNGSKNLDIKRLSIRAIQEMVKKYTKSSLPGKGKLSPHKMRSSFAMAFYEASGKDVLALQRKLGHHSLASTNIYVKATDTKMKETRDLLEKSRMKARK